MSPAEQVPQTYLGGTQSNSATLCPTTFQKPECPGRPAPLCFSPALAAGQAWAGASASPQLLLSAPRGFEECPPPDPEPGPWSWSAPGSSCSACPSEGCAVGSWPVEAGGPGSGCSCADGGAEQGLASSAAEGQEVC